MPAHTWVDRCPSPATIGLSSGTWCTMPSERVQRRIERLLDEADEAIARSDWDVVRDRSQNVIALDPDNGDARTFLSAAERALGGAAAESAPAATAPATPTPTLPTSFADGRYQVKKFLGEGGIKLVYLAHDTTLDREVAFALIKTEGLDETSRTHITREAQAMGRLGAHPHIMTVFDLGEHNGQPYIVTELMGSDVEGAIEDAADNRLPLEQAIEIAKATCRGLEFAHSKGIVHRDLKPGNVMLTADGTAKIGDFGLAVATDRSRLTQEGKMVGTALYMPPEQAMGGDVTPLADLYSLGAMLYEMVTGRPPFLGDNDVAIIGQHLNTPPVAPTWHNPDVPQALETLVLRLLEKGPTDRPASASEVMDALESIDLTPLEPDAEAAAPSGPDPTYRKAFVGRETEIRQLHMAFDEAMSGRGSLVMVVGEPGIGKTSLCEQLQTYASLRGGTTLIGHCYEEGSLSLPYLAFVEAMRSYVLDRDADGLKSDLGSGASDVARIVSDVRDRLQVEPSEPGDPEQDRYRLMQAVTSFLTNAASVQPLVIVLEDLHDSDGGTLDMLTHVSRNLSGARLMIVGTYRDVEVDRSHSLSGTLAELRRVSSFARISLRGLTADEVQRMMTSIAGHDVPWGISEAVHRQTEGNPLFVQEVLRYLVEEGVLARGDGAAARQTPPEMRIPEGLRDVIGKRLSRLSSEANSVLGIAAVVGRDFRLDVLQKVADLSEDELFAALEEAQGAAVIEERSATGTGVGFRFAHALFKQTLYEEIFAPRRIRLHQQVGRAFEEVYSGRLEEHAAELTEHFAQSTEHEDLEKALSYGEMAAGRAMSVYAYGEAVRLLDQALEVQEVLDPDNKVKRCDLLLAVAGAMMPAGESLRVYESVLPDAFALAESLNDSERASSVCQLAVEAAQRTSYGALAQEPEFLTWAERADRFAAPGTRHRALADLAMSIVRFTTGDSGVAWTLRQRALDLARRLSDDEAFQTIATLIMMHEWAPQHQEERLELAREVAVKYFDAVDNRGQTQRLDMFPLGPLGNAFMAMGDRDRAEEFWSELKERTERTQDANWLMGVLLHEAWIAQMDGLLEQVVAMGERIAARGEELGLPYVGRLNRILAIMAPFLYLGRAEELLAEGLEFAQAAERLGIRDQNRANILAHAGRIEEALELSRRYMADGRYGEQDDETNTGFLLMMLDTAVLAEDREAAEVLYGRLAGLSSHALVFRNAGTAFNLNRILGKAATLLGDHKSAQTHYLRGAQLMERIRFRPELGLTRLELAELLLDHFPDERAEALEHLDFAIAELRDMKMQPALERALSRREILGA